MSESNEPWVTVPPEELPEDDDWENEDDNYDVLEEWEHYEGNVNGKI